MTLTILELLYIVLIIFASIIWTLLVIILLRVIKVLWPLVEIADFYNKIKKIFSYYAQIPEMLKEKVSEIIKWKTKKEEK